MLIKLNRLSLFRPIFVCHTKMLSIPFSWVVTFYLAINRLSKIGVIIPFMVGISVFFNTNPSFQLWGTQVFGMYHLLSLIYLLLEGTHLMILKFRTTSFDNLISDPLLYARLTPGTVVCTDKKFNFTHSIWCLLLGTVKAAIAYLQAQYFTQDTLFQILFWTVFGLAILVFLAEVIMMAIITQNLEYRFMSLSLNIEMENVPDQIKKGCKYLFKVTDSTAINVIL